MKVSFEIIEKFNVSPEVIFEAWLNSKLHSEMTGGNAFCSSEIGGTFSTWDGYITGTNISLKKNQEIVQTWRTTEFKEGDEDSILTIQLKELKNGTEFKLIHTKIPEGQTQYKIGWKEYYFEPMRNYFHSLK
jgi:activator of HSP90 ATPase